LAASSLLVFGGREAFCLGETGLLGEVLGEEKSIEALEETESRDREISCELDGLLSNESMECVLVII